MQWKKQLYLQHMNYQKESLIQNIFYCRFLTISLYPVTTNKHKYTLKERTVLKKGKRDELPYTHTFMMLYQSGTIQRKCNMHRIVMQKKSLNKEILKILTNS